MADHTPKRNTIRHEDVQIAWKTLDRLQYLSLIQLPQKTTGIGAGPTLWFGLFCFSVGKSYLTNARK